MDWKAKNVKMWQLEHSVHHVVVLAVPNHGALLLINGVQTGPDDVTPFWPSVVAAKRGAETELHGL